MTTGVSISMHLNDSIILFHYLLTSCSGYNVNQPLSYAGIAGKSVAA